MDSVLKVGDVVRLRGPAGRLMTVKSVSAAGVLCEWSDGGKKGELTVAPKSLERVTTPVCSAHIHPERA
ncbi:MAG: hypothetical protein ABSC22_17635 [Roseiarcus sp.]|jgi:uncharacterized protein YodC (DUF2158 family)